MSPRSSRDLYTPLIPSPLNPEGHADDAPSSRKSAEGWPAGVRAPTISTPSRKRRARSYDSLSPTQLLQRQKGQEAWMSIKALARDSHSGRRVKSWSHANNDHARSSSGDIAPPHSALEEGRRNRAYWEEEADMDDYDLFGDEFDFDDDDDDDDELEKEPSGPHWELCLMGIVVYPGPPRLLLGGTPTRWVLLLSGLMFISACLPFLALILVVGRGGLPFDLWFSGDSSTVPAVPPPPPPPESPLFSPREHSSDAFDHPLMEYNNM